MFPSSEESQYLANKLDFKDWMVSRYLRYISHTEDFLKQLNKSHNEYIRINTLKTDTKEIIKRLEKKEILLESTIFDEVFKVIKTRYPIGATQEYLSGYYYIQDLSSCHAVNALDIDDNDSIILDMASSPGGKTTFIAQKMKNKGTIISIESNRKRLKRLEFNLSRCGIINTCIYNLDGKDIEKLHLKFDKVLLDAPCSCDGIIQKDTHRKYTYKPETIEYCYQRQIQLIESAASCVKPEGLLVYSTCSFAPEENELVVNSLFDKYEMEIEEYKFGYPGLSNFGDLIFHPHLTRTKRFYPHLDSTLGFYLAKIRIRGKK